MLDFKVIVYTYLIQLTSYPCSFKFEVCIVDDMNQWTTELSLIYKTVCKIVLRWKVLLYINVF